MVRLAALESALALQMQAMEALALELAALPPDAPPALATALHLRASHLSAGTGLILAQLYRELRAPTADGDGR